MEVLAEPFFSGSGWMSGIQRGLAGDTVARLRGWFEPLCVYAEIIRRGSLQHTELGQQQSADQDAEENKQCFSHLDALPLFYGYADAIR